MKTYTLLGADGRPYASGIPGAWGGHRRTKIYGRLDCPAALRAIARGSYVRHRVFFADEQTAIAAGYRPCAACCEDRYRAWKARRGHAGQTPADKIDAEAASWRQTTTPGLSAPRPCRDRRARR